VPVYEQTYRHYEGVYRPRTLIWTIIASRGIRRVWQTKWFKMVLFFCLAPFLIRAIQIYLSVNLELLQWMGFPAQQVEELLAIDDLFYLNFLQSQMFACFLITLIAGADLIASDRRTKALTLYLSKPITRLDYLFGKGAVALTYLYGVTLIPALLLMFLYAFFHEDWGYFWSQRTLFLRIVVYSHVLVLPMVLMILAVSSLSKSKVNSVVMFCVIYLIPLALCNILRETLDDPIITRFIPRDFWSLFCIQNIWAQLGNTVFHQDLPYEMHWMWYAAGMAVVWILCGWVLHRQIQAVEVVK